LKKALDAFGTDEEQVTAILTGRNKEVVGSLDIRIWLQTELVPNYAALYGNNDLQTLKNHIQDRCGGKYKEALLALLRPDAENLSIMLREAMKGIGTDEFALIAACCTLPASFVVLVRDNYARFFERDLVGDIKSEVSGHFKKALMMQAGFTKGEAYAHVCHQAIKGLGTDERSLIRVLTTATYEDIVLMNEAFSAKYGNLQQWIEGDTSGDFKNMLLALSLKKPMENPEAFDPQADAQLLRTAMKGMGTDERTLIEVLASKSDEQLEEIKAAYAAKFRRDLKSDVSKETKGLFESADFREALMGVLDPREVTIANYLRKAMKGWGTDEWGLISMLVHRSPAEREQLRKEYAKQFERDLVADIRSDCSGDFEDALVALVVPPADTIAKALNKAMGFFSTSHATLITMLCAATQIMPAVREAYERQFSKPLVEDIKSQLRGDYEGVLVAIASYTPPFEFELRV